jgi:hypothetical protein
MKKSQRLPLLKTVYAKWATAQENNIILDADMTDTEIGTDHFNFDECEPYDVSQLIGCNSMLFDY